MTQIQNHTLWLCGGLAPCTTYPLFNDLSMPRLIYKFYIFFHRWTRFTSTGVEGSPTTTTRTKTAPSSTPTSNGDGTTSLAGSLGWRCAGQSLPDAPALRSTRLGHYSIFFCWLFENEIVLATTALRAFPARSGSKGDIIDIMYRYWLPKFE